MKKRNIRSTFVHRLYTDPPMVQWRAVGRGRIVPIAFMRDKPQQPFRSYPTLCRSLPLPRGP